MVAGAAAQTPSAPRPFVEEQRQQERERALREQQERTVDVRLPTAADRTTGRLTESEAPCFRIDRLVLEGERAEGFQWLLREAAGEHSDDTPIGRCLGTQGVNIVIERLQQALIAQGWVTSRVLAAPQDLASGTLRLTLVPGRIAAIRFAEGTTDRTSLRTAIPATPGDLLNLRDIEQGLENLKRLPTAEADIQIEPSQAPGAQPGDSDLVVKYSRAQRALGPLRATLSLDDSGTKSTGRTQGGATLAWDGPLGLNDLAYVSFNHDLFNHDGQGTSGQTLHYSVPFGYWLLGAIASQSKYHQSVAGFSQDYVYAGETRNAELRLSRLVYRDQRRKTTLWLRGFRRASNNFIDDTEIEVQRRVVGGWELGANHREFIGQATFDANLQYRRGTGAFGGMPAPEEFFGDGTSRFRLIAADANLNLPIQIGTQKLRYTALWRAQWNRTPLTPQDRFSIGGRYTVRGFDGETSLMAERGWLVRNDIGWALGATGAELYLGIDHGEVGGASAEYLQGKRLTGGVVGLRGALPSPTGLSYDVFVGAPNRLLHYDEKERINVAAEGDSVKAERLARAACYVTQCWAQFPEGSELYRLNHVSAIEAGGLTSELGWVAYEQRGGLFNYTAFDKATDRIASITGMARGTLSGQAITNSPKSQSGCSGQYADCISGIVDCVKSLDRSSKSKCK